MAELAAGMGDEWRAALRDIVERWHALEGAGDLTRETAQEVARQVLEEWPDLIVDRYEDLLDRIYVSGFLAGIVDTGVVVGADSGDRNVLRWIMQNPAGFVPALANVSDDGVAKVQEILAESYAGERPFDLDEMSRAVTTEVGEIGRQRAELIVRTETAQATALGRIEAWRNDPDRDEYWYHWIATHDDRTKDVSYVFERGGPYTFDEILELWTVDHRTPQLVLNRWTNRMEWQTSMYNCRCSCSRTPKPPKVLHDEGLISDREYAAMTG